MPKTCLIFAAVFFLPLSLIGQNTSIAPQLSGTLNGSPIPDKLLNPSRRLAIEQFVYEHQRGPSSAADEAELQAKIHGMQCAALQTALAKAAREAEKRRLGIAVTKQDLEAARLAYPPRDPAAETAELKSRATAILTALSAVYDHGQNVDQVYTRLLKNQIPRNLWTVYVHDAQTVAGRQAVERKFRDDLLLTPAIVAKGTGSLESWRPTAETMKLDEAVDQQIASTDPTFQAYLNEYKSSERREGNQVRSNMNPDHRRYLIQKRKEFWKDREASVDVYLSDPSLMATCDLTARSSARGRSRCGMSREGSHWAGFSV